MILYRKTKILKSSVCASFIMLAIGASHAADLPTATLPVMEDVQYDQQVEYGSGWYLRGDVGVAIGQEPDISTRSTVGDVKYKDIKTDQQGTFGVGFGYSFESGFRSDLTFDYTAPMKYSGRANYANTGIGPYPYDFRTENRRHTGTLMLNGYYDLNGMGKFRPYVGAGVGIAWTEVYNSKATDPHIPTTTHGRPGYIFPTLAYGHKGVQYNKTSTNFAWALMAGVAYQLTNTIDLDVGYKYLNIGTVKTGGTPFVSDGEEISGGYSHWVYSNFTRLKNVGDHQIRVGLRYKFDN